MVRIATVTDAEQLDILNDEFNGRGETTIEMITYAESYCSKNYSLHKYELLTGKKNTIAQSVYGKLGYVDDGEIHLSKK